MSKSSVRVADRNWPRKVSKAYGAPRLILEAGRRDFSLFTADAVHLPLEYEKESTYRASAVMAA